MNRIIVLLLICSALAGCTEPEIEAVPEVDTTTSEPGNVTVAPLVLSVDQTEVVLQGTGSATLSGSVTPGATVWVGYDRDLGLEAIIDNGTWFAEFQVPFGHTEAQVIADDGISSASQNITIKRNMLLTVEVDHDTAQGKADRSDAFYWDYGGLRSMHEDESYEGCEQPHPGRPNAHDALLEYSDVVGVPITYTPCGSFGVSVDDVDDVDYGPLGWCFIVNGEAAEFGISLLELDDGDVFAFQNCGGLF